jgi:hypothetical protein
MPSAEIGEHGSKEGFTLFISFGSVKSVEIKHCSGDVAFLISDGSKALDLDSEYRWISFLGMVVILCLCGSSIWFVRPEYLQMEHFFVVY